MINFSKFTGSLSKGVLKMIIVGVFLVVLVFLGFKAYSYGRLVFSEHGVDEEPGTDILVTIEDGLSNKELAEFLDSYGLVENPTIFRIQLQLYGAKNKIVPGQYTLNTSESGEDIINIITGQVGVTESEESTTNEATTAASKE